ncbi:hypothetical protein CMV_002743, partial [Castanea mollissima]
GEGKEQDEDDVDHGRDEYEEMIGRDDFHENTINYENVDNVCDDVVDDHNDDAIEFQDDIGDEGSLPKEIGNAASLQRLVLNNNLLGGTIPKEIRNLTNLSVLNLNSKANMLEEPSPRRISALFMEFVMRLLHGHIEKKGKFQTRSLSASKLHKSKALGIPGGNLCCISLVGWRESISVWVERQRLHPVAAQLGHFAPAQCHCHVDAWLVEHVSR